MSGRVSTAVTQLIEVEHRSVKQISNEKSTCLVQGFLNQIPGLSIELTL